MVIRGPPDFVVSQWNSLDKYTSAPYHLTLKSNGCLILVSAIEPDVLLVTSKHALGESVSGPDKEEGSLNHAQMGLVPPRPRSE
jgi:tRNA ligase